MSSNGVYLGDGPSWLSYEDKICPECGDLTRIKVSHSWKNPNKLYHWCDTHQFVGWCLPTNVEMSPPPTTTTYRRTTTENKWKKGVDDFKVCVRNKYGELRTSCNGNSIPAMVFGAIVALVFVGVTRKFNVM
ncbi:hypothetical protein L6164_005111 [Bauhinia variegata]|uniref:Uncharacterized protein n=1 Tax=Bauhinia variegata TaxID=167791 RepID=A0ACB9PPK6_BAUVA|nr:hypothetical protein L6164_005111 [Bauhinia variegata]